MFQSDPTTITLSAAAALSFAAQLIAYGQLKQKADSTEKQGATTAAEVSKLTAAVAKLEGIMLGANGHTRTRRR